jgi:hypothetical protein
LVWSSYYRDTFRGPVGFILKKAPIKSAHHIIKQLPDVKPVVDAFLSHNQLLASHKEKQFL